MVLLLEKLFDPKRFPSNMEDGHHGDHRHETSLEALLQTFRSNISVPNPGPRMDSISFPHIHNLFDYLSNCNKAFAKLVVEIDYPISKWEISSIEVYLSYTLRFLDLLNLVKSSLYHVGQTRLAMTLNLVEGSNSSIQQLRSIEFRNFEIKLKLEDFKEGEFSGKGSVISQASIELKKNSDLVFGIILSSLSGDIKPYLELKNSEANSEDFGGVSEKNVVLKELKEINEAKACYIVAAEMGETSEDGDKDVRKIETELEEVQKQLDDIGKKVDDLFSEILSGRSEVLDVIRH